MITVGNKTKLTFLFVGQVNKIFVILGDMIFFAVQLLQYYREIHSKYLIDILCGGCFQNQWKEHL